MLKRNRRGLGKLVLSGSLVLALSVPLAGAASAASATPQVQMKVYSVTNPSNVNWSQFASQYGIDLNSLLQQIQQNIAKAGSGYAGSGYGTSTGNSGHTGSGTSAGNAGHAGSGTSAGSGSAGHSGSAGSGSGTTAAQSDFAAQVVNLVNQERAKAGLKSLKSDTKLTSVAVAKAKDMYNNHYFDHNSPTYGSPFDMMKQFGVSYSYAGENIAQGQQNPQAVMNAWMNSSGHRANILNANYTSIGVAYYNGEWVQEFTG